MLRSSSLASALAIAFSFILSLNEIAFCLAFSSVFCTSCDEISIRSVRTGIKSVSGSSPFAGDRFVSVSHLLMSLSETEAETGKKDSSPIQLQKDKNGIYDLQGKQDHV